MSFISTLLRLTAISGIGVFVYRRCASDMCGYLLGSRQIKPQFDVLVLPHKLAIAEILAGGSTNLVEINPPVLPDGQTLSRLVYEIIPGLITSSLVMWLVSAIGQQPNHSTTLMFEKNNRVLAGQHEFIGVRNE